MNTERRKITNQRTTKIINDKKEDRKSIEKEEDREERRNFFKILNKRK